MAPIRRKFDVTFKERAVQYAEEHSGERAAKHFGVDPKRIRYWRQQKDELRLADKKRARLPGAGRKKVSLELDANLSDLIFSMRDKHNLVSRKMIHNQTNEIYASQVRIQKTQRNPSVNDGPLSAYKASAAQQNISTALPSASKYKSDSREQRVKEEAIARWIVRSGLPVTMIEDEDFVLMMETVDRRLTVPKRTKISNLINKHYEHQSVIEGINDRGENNKIICPFYDESDWVSDDSITHPVVVMERATEEDMGAVTSAPSVKTEMLDYAIKMEESPEDDNNMANPFSQPTGFLGHDEDTDEYADPPAMPTLGDEGIGGLHNIRQRGRYDKRSNIQRVESQLSGLGERLLAECRREFEEMMSQDREWLEEDRRRREEQLRTWQQEFQTIIDTLTQSLHRKPTSSTPSGLLAGPCVDLTQAGCGSVSPSPQTTRGWSCEEEETRLGLDVSYGGVIPACTPPRSASVPLAETPAPPAASHRGVRRGAKRGRASPPPGDLSAFQQGVLHALNRDIGEEEHFLLSLSPALKRLDNRKKALVRLKFQQYLFDAEFSNDQRYS